MPVKPTVLIPCDVKTVGAHPFHCVGEKYINAVAHGADAWPLLLPAFGRGAALRALTGHVDLGALLATVDGVFLTGSPSNVAPGRYGGPPDPDMLLDPQRDALTLELIRVVIELGVPLFAVCRGIQELNVALGGTLHPAVHAVPGFMDHREPAGVPLAVQYAPAHAVRLAPDGALRRVLGTDEIRVNTVHGQGIRDLAPGLVVEGVAPDGLVEAVSCAGHPGFALGVQWHPEWEFERDPHSVALFRAFGEAARARRAARTGTQAPRAAT
jgi:putative glutamine amidotransferase